MFLGLIVSLFAVLTDQLSKLWILDNISADQVIHLGGYANIIKVWNTGVSFSMLNGHGLLGTICLSVAALLICAFLLYWMKKETQKVKILCLGFIIGGALGNVIDRINHGAVLDFLDFHYDGYHWPAFNLADTYICIGAFILICDELYHEYTKRKEKNENN